MTGESPSPAADGDRIYFENLKTRARDMLQRWDRDPEGMSQHDRAFLIEELKLSYIELGLQLDELRHTQDELREAHKRYYAFFDMAPVPYFVIDEKGIIREANLRGSELAGITRKRIRETRSYFISVLHPDSQPVFLSHLRRVFRSDTVVRSTVQLRTPSSHARGELHSRVVEFAEGEQQCLAYFSEPLATTGAN